MPFFTKKPVVIEAILLEENATSQVKAINWIRAQGGEANAAPMKGVSIITLEGVMLASWGDWIIKGAQGEFYPCKPDIFEATYETGLDV